MTNASEPTAEQIERAEWHMKSCDGAITFEQALADVLAEGDRPLTQTAAGDFDGDHIVSSDG